MVSERARREATPVIMTAPPAPPPRSTPVQNRMVQQTQRHPDNHPSSTTFPLLYASLDSGGEWGPASSGDLSGESSSPWFAGVRHVGLSANGNPGSSQDGPGCVPHSGTNKLNRTSSPVKSDALLQFIPPTSHQVCDDQLVAQGHVRDSSDICETSFDDVTSSTFKPLSNEVEATDNAVNNLPLQGQPCNEQPSPHQQINTLPTNDAGDKSEAEPSEAKLCGGTPRSKVAPPVPLRKSSTLQHSNSSQQVMGTNSAVDHVATSTVITSETRNNKSDLNSGSVLKHVPSLKDRKKQLEAQMTASSTPANPLQLADHTHPGRLVIQEELKGVSGGMPATQHPLLLKRQEETAAREREEREREEREREERERLTREMREKEEKAKGRFIFRRSRKGKGADAGTEGILKEQRRRSMPISEQDELQSKFKHITQSKPSSPGAEPSPNTTAEREREEEDERERLAKEKELREWEMREREEVCKRGLPPHPPEANIPPSLPQQPLATEQNSPSPHTHLASLPEHPLESQPVPPTARNGYRSSTLDRRTPKPPSSSPPSLPGSIDRRTWRHSGNLTNTLERQRPGGSRPGSKPGTLERKHPPPPTSQPPPPVLPEVRKTAYPKARSMTVAFSGGRMDLADLIPGVNRRALTRTMTDPGGDYTHSATFGPSNVKRKSIIGKRH